MRRTLPMTTTLLAALLLSSTALAAPESSEPTEGLQHPAPPEADGALEEATRLLSRQPAGRASDVPAVREALELLRQRGTRAHLPLLSSMGLEESPALARAAREAYSEVVVRSRHEARARVAATLASATPWSELSPERTRSDGSALGFHEAAALSYAHHFVGPVRTDLLELSPVELESFALRAEDRGQPEEAILLHAAAAAGGHTGAGEALRAYGVDPDLLLLGMLLSPDPAWLWPAPREVVSRFGTQGQDVATAALRERLETAGPRLRIQSVRTLAKVLESEASSSDALRGAREALETAANHGGELERTAVSLALEELAQGTPGARMGAP